MSDIFYRSSCPACMEPYLDAAVFYTQAESDDWVSFHVAKTGHPALTVPSSNSAENTASGV